MNTKYPNLLSPVKIGKVELRNKTVMAAMGMSQSDNGFVNTAVINHYSARAKGGVSAIVVEVTCVDTPLGLNTNGMLVIDDDKYIPGMTQLASAIHDGGAKAFLEPDRTFDDSLGGALVGFDEWNFKFPYVFSTVRYFLNNILNVILYGARYIL